MKTMRLGMEGSPTAVPVRFNWKESSHLSSLELSAGANMIGLQHLKAASQSHPKHNLKQLISYSKANSKLLYSS